MPDASPAALAVAGWRTPPGVRLDLRYAPDEAEWLDPRPAQLWQQVVADAADLGAEAAGHYPVDDPYGGERGSAVVGRAFGVALAPEQVTFGAGITGLLHGLAGLARGRTVVAPALSHPDLQVWARARGARVHRVDGPLPVDALLAAAERWAPAVVLLDRPDFCAQVVGEEALDALATQVARNGGVVVVDEAGANYLPPRESAIRVVPRVASLVVLRGFTKAYSLGGMRSGFAVASSGVAEEVRAVAAPLQVSELSLRVALGLLAAGDPCARLRRQIHAVRPVAVDLLGAAGLSVRTGHPDVPAVIVDDAGGEASASLERLGIRGLTPPVAGAELVQLRIPIGDVRVAELRRLLRR